MEARGAGAAGMDAQMHVVVNRAREWYDGSAGSICKVVYSPNQFSWIRADDPEHNTRPKAGDPLYQWAIHTAPYIAAASDADPTRGALYYANLDATPKDSWFYTHIVNAPKAHPFLVKIGRHSFFA